MGFRKGKQNLITSISFILLILLAFFILLRSSLFEVKQVVVKGNEHLSSEKIKALAEISPGINIFKINLTRVSERIHLLPMVKKVKLTRKLPSTVVITIIERRPVGLLPQNDSFMEIDEDGVCLQKGKSSTYGLPVITGVIDPLQKGLKNRTFTPGQQIKSTRLDLALKVIKTLPPEVLPILSEVNVEQQNQVNLFTLDGIQCRLGQATNIKEKGEILSQVLKEVLAKGKEVTYIDLSYSKAPVVKYTR